MDFSLHLSDDGNDDHRRAILAPLADHNTRHAGPSGNRPLAVLVKAADGEVQGGLWGQTGYGWLFTQLLVVPEPLRGQRVGTRILQLAEAEAEAVRRGCHAAWLDTFDFQARGFYERLGYRCFGELADYPTGHARFFMEKRLVEQRPASS